MRHLTKLFASVRAVECRSDDQSCCEKRCCGAGFVFRLEKSSATSENREMQISRFDLSCFPVGAGHGSLQQVSAPNALTCWRALCHSLRANKILDRNDVGIFSTEKVKKIMVDTFKGAAL